MAEKNCFEDREYFWETSKHMAAAQTLSRYSSLDRDYLLVLDTISRWFHLWPGAAPRQTMSHMIKPSTR